MPHLFERSDNVSRLFVATLLLALTSGCGGAGSYVWVHDLPRQPATAAQIERIRPGDLLSVRVQSLLQKYESLKGIIAIIGENELSPADRADYAKAKKLITNFTQDMHVMEKHNGIPGQSFTRDQTLQSIEEIIV